MIRKTTLAFHLTVISSWYLIFFMYHLHSQAQTTRKQTNIFLFETNPNNDEIGTKQMCAIESAAMHNPDASVQVYTLKAQINSNAAHYLFGKYKNIKIMRFDPEDVLGRHRIGDTSLLSFWKSGTVQESKFSYSHLSDFLRFVFMWTNGGIYLDMDIITLKSFQPLVELNKNGLGYLYEDGDSINNAVLIFTRKMHPFFKYILEKFVKNYDGGSWANNGPILLKRSLLKFCQVQNILEIELHGFKPASFKNQSSSHPCADLILFPETFFYPLSWIRNEHIEIFNPNSSSNPELTSKIKESSFAFHYNNQLSFDWISKPNDGSFFTSIAQSNCPQVYQYVEKSNLLFKS